MSSRAQIIAIAVALSMLLLVLELIRRRRLRVDYSLGWLATGVGLLILFALPRTVAVLARLMGIQQPQSLLFTAGIGFTLWLLLGQSLALTKLWRQDKNMAQENALLEWRLRQLEAELDELRTSLQPGPEPMPQDEELLPYAGRYALIEAPTRRGAGDGRSG